MLKTTQKITITGVSTIGDVNVAEYSAQIDSENPENMTLSNWQNNKELYKVNRTVCRADQAGFEDLAYQKQDELIAAKTPTIEGGQKDEAKK